MSIHRSLLSRVFMRTTSIESTRRWRNLRPSESVILSSTKPRKGNADPAARLLLQTATLTATGNEGDPARRSKTKGVALEAKTDARDAYIIAEAAHVDLELRRLRHGRRESEPERRRHVPVQPPVRRRSPRLPGGTSPELLSGL
jgi:hypothetical protein